VALLRSEPPGARVWVNGEERGEAPLELRLEPGREHALRLSAAGHEDAELRLRVEAGRRREQTVRLVPSTGEVRIVVRPPDAQLLVDGEPRPGRGDQTMKLLAVPHAIEARREGYETSTQTVTPRPGFPQTVELVLKSREQQRVERAPRVVRSPEGHELRLVEGGRFKLGAPRRDPGRRANEPLRDVELVRRFYVAAREVTNAQFRRFDSGHSSGRIGSFTLDLEDQPVVRVGWQDAARYCNWLSEREGLPRAYLQRDGVLVAASPLGLGYRLPTEAEWERAARYPEGTSPLRFPWGAALPVPAAGGNYADQRARGLVAQVIEALNDGHAVSAPVGSFAANALGLFDLGGNAAEWTHDRYVITPSVEGTWVRDPLGPAEGEYHVVRGASFLSGTVSELRLSSRDQGREPRPDLGFRVARYADSEGEP
jgi:formylglycine-generating enzyme required for sulfatase activity